MFATQNPSANGSRFANVSVNFPQQQPQQLQQQNPYQPLNPTTTSQQQPQSLLSVSGSSTNGLQTQREPEWFNNPKKRAIPQSIVKRTTKRSPSADSSQADNDSGSSTVRSGFNSIAFGTKRNAGGFQSSQIAKPTTNVEKNTGILIDSNEAPPSISLYDWQREDEFGTTLPQLNSNSLLPNDTQVASQSSSSSIKKGISTGTEFNAFDKGSVAKTNTQIRPESGGNDVGENLGQTHNESAVIVFGYPESISNLIITHFSKFGYILEDFEVLRSSSGINTATLRLHGSKPGRKYPIFTGDGWVKLTYDSPPSALRALEENGLVYGGSLIGCVPYNKRAVEQLASCKIEKEDDIGNLNFSVAPSTLADNGPDVFENGEDVSSVTSPQQFVNGKQDRKGLSPTKNTANNLLDHSKVAHPTRRLDIKDGKSLFVHNGAADNHYFLRSLEQKMRQQEENNRKQSSVLHKVNNWLFGWNEL
ncbi:hypothetical protein ZYGR_0A03490 [Zygosaccharomyces rouxii]|uniref:ZYRO0A07964p n=2 Tax=Zygosaccharomyces rouxii TaxID=4956 RepID=C5DQ19_ZYGRC|nr:uncharacterized protein ZYRO0A07964g [Zygosaccharomyces rouxii]KAH9198700.1 Nup53/35/40-type RNA recognition motif-domain-containing protein [Zygosaccharomyces rouxii]GAV46754.1 hypothetical protein ZYGR_0A03490 [Zygosaccharomyces rouxii]CAR25780.1 ZYRO0A07964p [Zygosaccharomyces rouxii]